MSAFSGTTADGCRGLWGRGVKAPAGREVGPELVAQGLGCLDGGEGGMNTSLEGNLACIQEREETGPRGRSLRAGPDSVDLVL